MAQKETVLIVTRNAVEAADIADALQARSPRPVLCVSSLQEAQGALEAAPLRCVFFGLDVGPGPSAEFLAALSARDIATVVIGDDAGAALQRPFTAEVLDAALSDAGF
jgi:hypothetical protein